ncbi:hypothetical protein D3H65_17990 [Paraflavitalea soli]|uniref:Uncharacterized protein n=1 Tax=Paraflavitalea soli TaxID=2315862 RepID=A0A3B7MPN0_9BACT|nr:hypothetical protein D3H65_17990 [Paraflavitalea soli]
MGNRYQVPICSARKQHTGLFIIGKQLRIQEREADENTSLAGGINIKLVNACHKYHRSLFSGIYTRRYSAEKDLIGVLEKRLVQGWG